MTHLNVLLLDVDGTLVHDLGYRRAMNDAATWLLQQRGLPAHVPDDEGINALHAAGFSNEWDSIPFVVGINLLRRLRAEGGAPDFAAWARKTVGLYGPPNHRAREALLREAPQALTPEIHALLDDVSDPRRTLSTRALYELVLGSTLNESHYGLAPLIGADSYLRIHDRCLLDDAGRALVRGSSSAVYTARPNLPLDGTPGKYQTPEAELALELCGLADVPLVGYGDMQWLADQSGASLLDLAKPAPAQPVAAMLAALGVPLRESLWAAHAVTLTTRVPDVIDRLNGREVLVFEDNAGGVEAALRARDRLAVLEVRITVRGLGVARDAAKRAALARVCEAVFDDINAALAYSIRQESA